MSENECAFPEKPPCGNCTLCRLRQANDRIAQLETALRDVLPEPGYPECDRMCVTVRGAAFDEDPRCDCSSGETRWRFDNARAILTPTRETPAPESK